ncbi:MAG TPA: hypothetical protein VMR18_03155 [Candidatus Saccharimonadales bacterium]|nr:hypothetical protein [Candidatus Saccharimonadales bacterium]
MNSTTMTTSLYGQNLNSTTPTGTGKSLLVFFLVYIVAIVAFMFITFFWFFKFSKAINQYTHGLMGTGVTFLLLWLLHFIGVAIVQDSFNDMLSSDGTNSPQPPPVMPAGPPVVTPSGPSAGVPPGPVVQAVAF